MRPPMSPDERTSKLRMWRVSGVSWLDWGAGRARVEVVRARAIGSQDRVGILDLQGRMLSLGGGEESFGMRLFRMVRYLLLAL